MNKDEIKKLRGEVEKINIKPWKAKAEALEDYDVKVYALQLLEGFDNLKEDTIKLLNHITALEATEVEKPKLVDVTTRDFRGLGQSIMSYSDYVELEKRYKTQSEKTPPRQRGEIVSAEYLYTHSQPVPEPNELVEKLEQINLLEYLNLEINMDVFTLLVNKDANLINEVITALKHTEPKVEPEAFVIEYDEDDVSCTTGVLEANTSDYRDELESLKNNSNVSNIEIIPLYRTPVECEKCEENKSG